MVNEKNMDFRISGLPHSLVKHAQSTSVRELIQKIENHPNRHALQQDLQQNQSFNPRIKENDSGCGQHRIVWIARDGSQNAVHSMPIILERRHRLLHMRGISCRKKQRPIEISLSIRWTFFHFQSKSSRRETSLSQILKKQETKNIICLTNWRRNAKIKKFQGIHHEFLRYHEFRVQLIEHNRAEEVCQRWDVLANEDHTYHLSEEEYFYYKNKWWLHLNKLGFDTLPLRKLWLQANVVYLRTFTPRSLRRTIRAHLFLQAQTLAVCSEFILYMVELAIFLVFFSKIKKSESQKRGRQSFWEWTERRFLDITLAKTSGNGCQEFNLFCFR